MGRIGVDYDVVTLTLRDEVVLRSTSYDIQQSVIVQPSAFSLQLGTDVEPRSLMAKYPAGTPFSLAIDNVVQFTGVTDGYTASDSGGTAFNIRGRDTLAFLQGAYVRSDKTFSDITYRELVEQVLALAGPNKSWDLLFSNEANRKAVSKSQAPAGPTADSAVSSLVDTLLGELPDDSIAAQLAEDANAKAPSQQSRTLRAKAGQKWYAWLKAELDRAGLMLWADRLGSFILCAPDTKQAPCARITRKRGDPRPMVLAGASYRNETTERYSECIVHMRRGGGTEARGRGYGQFIDKEMVALGFDRAMVIPDTKCKTLAQADIMARRKIAESRRAMWQLFYPLAGHSAIGLKGERVYWTPDTVVEVDDDEYGLHGNFYVESVGKSRRSETQSGLNLMRLDDVLYGTEGEAED